MESQGEKYAIVVGIEHYRDRDIEQVHYAEADATELYRAITQAPRNAYNPDNVELRLSNRATLDELAACIRETFDKIRSEDSLLFFFAGHGHADEIGGYLVPSDYRMDSELTTRALPIALLNEYLRSKKPESFIFLFDCCHSGWALDKIQVGYDRNAARATFLQAEEVRKPITSGTGRVVICSSQEGEISKAFSELGHGLFTYYLLEGMRGNAVARGEDSVDVNGLYAYVAKEIHAYAKTRGFSQTPVMQGRVKGRFLLPLLSPCPAAALMENRPSRVHGNSEPVVARVEKPPAPVAGTCCDGFLKMEFVWVPGGEFEMGDVEDTGKEEEKPVHTVRVSGFWIGRYPVTQGQWRRVMRNHPVSFGRGGNTCPVERVSWKDAQEFLAELGARNGGDFVFRLPTEAEWEYACRSGGKTFQVVGRVAAEELVWYGANSHGTTKPVGGKQPNGLGLHDMLGNVSEWCSDWFDAAYYHDSPGQDPQGPREGRERAIRGGAWCDPLENMRCSARGADREDFRGNTVGFRVVMSAGKNEMG